MVRMDPNRFKACLFKALADPIRLKILQILQKKEMCVNEMVTALKINKTASSFTAPKNFERSRHSCR